MKAALIALALLAATQANASTVTLVSDTTSIVVGQSITFSVLVDNVVHPSAFGGSGAFIRSGDGQVQGVGLGLFGHGDTATFTYLTAGDYWASAVGQLWFDTWVCNIGPVVGCGPLLMSAGGGEDSQSFTVFEHITVLALVPEPATWALLLFGFAFFAIKGIWPTRKSHG